MPASEQENILYKKIEELDRQMAANQLKVELLRGFTEIVTDPTIPVEKLKIITEFTKELMAGRQQKPSLPQTPQE